MSTTRLLEGVRVLEFGHVWAAPLCGQMLADLGAEVIRVESRHHLDVHRRAGPYPEGTPGINRSGVWNAQNRGTLSCSLNLRDPRGARLALKLVERSQIVLENFAPGTLERRGLGYSHLREVNPQVVLVSLTGYGQDGPWRDYPAYGPMLDAAGGLAWATRDREGRPQSVNGWFPDVSAAAYGALAAITGLRDARATGVGSHQDIAQVQTTLSLEPELMALASAGSIGGTGTEFLAEGELQLVLPCAGEDRWIAVHLRGETDLLAFSEALGKERPLDAAGLRSDLDLTRALDRDELCEVLQSRGIEAVPVLSAADLVTDAHLAARRAFIWQMHPEAGAFLAYDRLLHDDELAPLRPAPLLGEHNHYVLNKILGYSVAEISSFVADDVVV